MPTNLPLQSPSPSKHHSSANWFHRVLLTQQVNGFGGHKQLQHRKGTTRERNVTLRVMASTRQDPCKFAELLVPHH